jgi:hypothetical protein
MGTTHGYKTMPIPCPCGYNTRGYPYPWVKFPPLVGSFLIKDGSEIRFWEDKWLGNTTLREKYPALQNIVSYKGNDIAKVFESSPPNMIFRRDLVLRLASWHAFLRCLTLVNLTQGTDEFSWILHESGKFSIDSM